jgi:hypothetical protein
VPTWKSLNIKPHLNFVWDEFVTLRIGWSSSFSSSMIMLCIINTCIHTSVVLEVVHNPEGSIRNH